MPARWGTIAGVALVGLGCARPGDIAFTMHVINAESRFEGAAAVDVNNDGRLDIHCGGFWHEAPSWTKHFVRDVQEISNYYLDFCSLPVDVDGDGWTDTVTCTWHDKSLYWVRNPGPAGGPFETIKIDEPGNMETAILVDFNVDGRPDVLPNVVHGTPAWYSFHRDATAKHGVRWDRHLLPAGLEGEGVGAGDINGDGRCDVVGCKGWAEAGANPSDVDAWLWHAEFDLIGPSIPILVHDVDGDGDMDLIWGIGHNYGLYWLEQGRNAVGARVWSRHEIDVTWSQAHVVLLGDLNGDGRKELVTGKRYYAHNGGDPGANEPRCLYAYTFDPASRTWRRHAIQEGGPAGIGLSAELVDIDGDGDLDFIAPGKSGLYLFENLLRP